MIKLVCLGLFGLVLFFRVVSSRVQSSGNPALAIRQLGGGQIQLNSPVNAAGVVLEQANVLALTIHNGLAYVADPSAGNQVLNYLSYDGNHLPPTIPLSTSR